MDLLQTQWPLDMEALKATVSIVGSFGSVLAVAQTCLELLQSRTLVIKRNKELSRANELANLLVQFSNERIPEKERGGFQKHVQLCLQECLENLEKLGLKLASIRDDPNSRLKVQQKLFLAFPPQGWRAWVVHLLAYGSAFLFAWNLFESGLASGGGNFSLQAFKLAWGKPDTYVTFAALLFLVLLFRAWALAERRHFFGYRKPSGPLARWFVMRVPESWRMLAAQVMFLLGCLALGCFFYAWYRNLDNSYFTIAVGLLLPVLLLDTVIYHGWAQAEFLYAGEKPAPVSLKTAFAKNFFKTLPQYGWARVKFFLVCVLLLPAALLLFALLIGDPLLFLAIFGALSALPFYAALRTLKIVYSVKEAQDNRVDGQFKSASVLA